MDPADDVVAVAGVMAMSAEVAAEEFKLNAHILVAAGFDLDFGVTVGVAVLRGFYDEAERMGKHAKEKDYAHFICRFKGEAGEAERSAEERAVRVDASRDKGAERRSSGFSRRSRDEDGEHGDGDAAFVVEGRREDRDF